MVRSVSELGKEYILSAERICGKIADLKELKGRVVAGEQEQLDERIVLLEAQYGYLVRTAAYLENYYTSKNGIKVGE